MISVLIMGNTCVGRSLSKNGFFQSVSATIWQNQLNKEALPAANGKATGEGTLDATASARSDTDAPQPVKIQNEETKSAIVPEWRPSWHLTHPQRTIRRSPTMSTESLLWQDFRQN
ncbi:hypothetical protein MUK42_28015 [Musa troglodytarum]|uniref:Uncharacterized protein n=1 Tax=Musa troglodytarum TaxID=320322 RepID=A0A9E7FXJ5_9LILI|nr:hypothetical protein MUK42_28015 [Musa troglodytarum]